MNKKMKTRSIEINYNRQKIIILAQSVILLNKMCIFQ